MTGGATGEPPASVGDITSHLFILAPNNSGSTFLMRALARSRGAWSLRREGQHMPGFQGPSTRGTGTRLLWAANRESRALFRDRDSFDWVKTRRAWHFYAVPSSPDATVLVVATPPFVLYADQLRENFADASFIVMVRNPYAVVEGVCRRANPGPVAPDEDRRVVAARHVITALRYQRDNIAALGERAAFFTYEAMCATPREVERQIAALAPALADVDLDQRIEVKSLYDEKLRDMNADQIARLSREDIAAINGVFDADIGLLDHFGYRRLPS